MIDPGELCDLVCGLMRRHTVQGIKPWEVDMDGIKESLSLQIARNYGFSVDPATILVRVFTDLTTEATTIYVGPLVSR